MALGKHMDMSTLMRIPLSELATTDNAYEKSLNLLAST